MDNRFFNAVANSTTGNPQPPTNPQPKQVPQPQQIPPSKEEAVRNTVLDRLLDFLGAKPKQQPAQTPNSKQQKVSATTPTIDNTLQLPSILETYHKEVQRYTQTLNNLGSLIQQSEVELQQNLKEMNSKLHEVMNLALVHLAKTPLGQFTGEDFLHHVNQAINYLPYQALGEGVNKIIKGYYLAKSTGMDTSGLTFSDLLEIADDPTYIKSTDENTLKMLDVVSKTLTNGINQHLQQYKIKVDNLALQSEILKTAFTMYDKEAGYQLEAWKMLADQAYKNSLLALERERLNFSKSQEKDFLNQLYKAATIYSIFNKADYNTGMLDIKAQQLQNSGGFENLIQNLNRGNK